MYVATLNFQNNEPKSLHNFIALIDFATKQQNGDTILNLRQKLSESDKVHHSNNIQSFIPVIFKCCPPKHRIMSSVGETTEWNVEERGSGGGARERRFQDRIRRRRTPLNAMRWMICGGLMMWKDRASTCCCWCERRRPLDDPNYQSRYPK